MSKETTHIRIDKDLKQQLQVMARCDETINDVIRRLVNGEPVVHQSVNNPVNTSILEDMQALTRRVQVLEEKEAKKEPDHYDHPMITGRSQDSDHIKSESDQENKDTTYLDTSTTKYLITYSDQERGIISISPDLRAALVSKFDELMNGRGLTVRQINNLVGVRSTSMICEIRSGKRKTLHEQVFQALMNL